MLQEASYKMADHHLQIFGKKQKRRKSDNEKEGWTMPEKVGHQER
jgi:hypothetical protein